MFVCKEAHVTFGGSGGTRSTARPELLYPCVSQTKSRDKTSRRGKQCYGVEPDINRYANTKSNRKEMDRKWSNQKANPALKTKTGNK